MKKRRHILLISILSLSLIFSGCWDNIDIDRKIFISTIAVDPGKDIGKQKELKNIKPDIPFGEKDIKKLNIILGFPDVSKIGPNKSGGSTEQFIKTEAYSMEDAISSAISKSSRNIFFGQSKLLIFSSDIMDYPDIFKEIMDYFQRSPRINRMMYVVIAQGKAEEYVDYKAPMEKNIEAYISGVMENSSENSTILPVTLNEVFIDLSHNGNAIMPVIKLNKDKNELSLSGVGIIKNYKLVGILNKGETSNLEILRGKLKGGKKAIYLKGHPLDIALDSVKRKIELQKYDKSNKKLKFYVDIKLEGSLKEYYLNKQVFDNSTIINIEKYFNKSIGEECEKTVAITKEEFKVDPIGFRENIEKYHPDIWEQVKDNWEEVYSNAEIKVNVNTHIRRIGIAK